MYITVDNVIEVPITFVKTVHVEKVLTIDAGLETLTLMGIDVNKWIDIAVFINSGRIPGIKIKYYERIVKPINSFYRKINF